MKSTTILSLAMASLAHAHYTFPYYIDPTGNVTGEWEYVRETENHYSNAPVTDVNSTAIACYQLTTGDEGATTGTVAAGDTVGLQLDTDISHPGPLQWYMAKAPTGETAATMNGSDPAVNWFKIAEDSPTINSSGLYWPAEGKTSVSVTIPSCLEAGYYLLRVESIAIHSAEEVGGAQFYLSCTQLEVTGGGDFAASADDSCTFPGCYNGYEPGILIDIYYPVPTTYINPGPTPITCGASAASATGSAAAAAATSAATTTSAAAVSVETSSATSSSLSVASAETTSSSSSTVAAVATASSSAKTCSKRKRRNVLH